jgi:hypothetical protein
MRRNLELPRCGKQVFGVGQRLVDRALRIRAQLNARLVRSVRLSHTPRMPPPRANRSRVDGGSEAVLSSGKSRPPRLTLRRQDPDSFVEAGLD